MTYISRGRGEPCNLQIIPHTIDHGSIIPHNILVGYTHGHRVSLRHLHLCPSTGRTHRSAKSSWRRLHNASTSAFRPDDAPLTPAASSSAQRRRGRRLFLRPSARRVPAPVSPTTTRGIGEERSPEHLATKAPEWW
jgi:hypothetical protein